MSRRISHFLATCGCLALIGSWACKSDSSLKPNESVGPIPNPSGPLNLGDVVSLNVNGNDACSNAIYHGAKVVAIGSKAMILNDTLNPPNGFTTADFERYAARFDTLVYPLDVANFGEPLDIDKNGHIIILFTRAVNELTEPKSTSYVGGFFFSRDLFPIKGTARATACASSNQGEYFYVLAPDPLGLINGNVRTTGFVDSATTSVLAHEFEHLINASRRLYVNNSVGFEEKWLDEGLAHIAEELLFYREAGVAPRMNLDVTAIRASRQLKNAYNADMLGNQGRYRTYLQAPASSSPYSPNDSLSTRGAAWSLLRYAVDRVNARDGFVAGTGQTVVGAGDVTLTPGAAFGEYAVTVVNTDTAKGRSTTYGVKSAPGIGTVSMPVEPAPVSTMLRLPSEDAPSTLRTDDRFEARLRTRERTALTPLMGEARRWYAEQGMPSVSASRSRSSLATSSFADADATFWFRLVNSTTAGSTNLQSAINGDLAAFVRDWSVSHAVDDVAALNTEYQQRSWNWHSIYPAVGSGTGIYPLQSTPITTPGTVTGSVVAGGAAFHKITVPAIGTATLTLTGPAGAVSTTLQMIVVRTK